MVGDWVFKWSKNGRTIKIFYFFYYFHVFKKGDDGLVVCKSKTGQIEQYYNPDADPTWLDPTNKSVGLTNSNVQKTSDWLVCSFKREKLNADVNNYFDLIQKEYYVLAAYGKLTGQYLLLNYLFVVI